jgi:hypothetical protein
MFVHSWVTIGVRVGYSQGSTRLICEGSGYLLHSIAQASIAELCALRGASSEVRELGPGGWTAKFTTRPLFVRSVDPRVGRLAGESWALPLLSNQSHTQRVSSYALSWGS